MMQRWQDRTPTYGCLLRFGSISVIIIVILGLGVLWMMATGSMLPSSWASIFTIVFVLLGVLFTFFQWVFPLSSTKTQNSSPLPVSRMSQNNPSSLSFKIPQLNTSGIFIHKANSTNSIKNYTTLDSPNTNGKPHAYLFVTPIWDDDKIYNTHPIGTGYREDVKKWSIFNQDKADMIPGTAFNVLVLEDDGWM